MRNLAETEYQGDKRKNRNLSRRALLRLGGATVLALALDACSSGGGNIQPTPTSTPSPTKESSNDVPNGMTLTSWTRGELASQGGQALKEIADTGAEGVALIPTWYQDTTQATTIYSHPDKTSSDQELKDTIKRAQDLGLKVMLKPHIDLPDNSSGTTPWRGEIGAGYIDKPEWRSAWMDSYRKFILHYADLAEGAKVDVFSGGNELKGVSHSDEFEHIVDDLGGTYKYGTLTYAANYGEIDQIPWWGIAKLKAIGVNDYTPTGLVRPTVQELKEWWQGPPGSQSPQGHMKDYSDLHAQYGKPIIVAEIGYASSSAAFTNAGENPTGVQPDEELQAVGYEAALATFALPLMRNIIQDVYWWNWYPGGVNNPSHDISYSPQGKKAQEIFTSYNRRK